MNCRGDGDQSRRRGKDPHCLCTYSDAIKIVILLDEPRRRGQSTREARLQRVTVGRKEEKVKLGGGKKAQKQSARMTDEVVAGRVNKGSEKERVRARELKD